MPNYPLRSGYCTVLYCTVVCLGEKQRGGTFSLADLADRRQGVFTKWGGRGFASVFTGVDNLQPLFYFGTKIRKHSAVCIDGVQLLAQTVCAILHLNHFLPKNFYGRVIRE